MSRATDLLTDAFSRVHGTVHRVVDGLDQGALAHRPRGSAGSGEPGNSIAWLIWHLTRVQDDHVADVADTEQVWTASGWAERFALPLPAADTGYGHDSAQVDALATATAEQLTGYFDAVHHATLDYLAELGDRDDAELDRELDRIVDTRWDPPVTLAVRLVSVVDDDTQHAGQAAYVRGLLGHEVDEG